MNDTQPETQPRPMFAFNALQMWLTTTEPALVEQVMGKNLYEGAVLIADHFGLQHPDQNQDVEEWALNTLPLVIDAQRAVIEHEPASLNDEPKLNDTKPEDWDEVQPNV